MVKSIAVNKDHVDRWSILNSFGTRIFSDVLTSIPNRIHRTWRLKNLCVIISLVLRIILRRFHQSLVISSQLVVDVNCSSQRSRPDTFQQTDFYQFFPDITCSQSYLWHANVEWIPHQSAVDYFSNHHSIFQPCSFFNWL